MISDYVSPTCVERFEGRRREAGIVPYAINLRAVVKLEKLCAGVCFFEIVDVHADVVSVIAYDLFIGPGIISRKH